VADRDPPQRLVGLGGALEPLPAAGEQAQVVAAVGVVPQGLDRLPDRAVDEQSVVVVVGSEAGGVFAVVVHHAPDEPRGAFGERVDLRQLGDEVGHFGAVPWGDGAGDVDLGEVESSHGDSMAGAVIYSQ
jgi:hypothetical protein